VQTQKIGAFSDLAGGLLVYSCVLVATPNSWRTRNHRYGFMVPWQNFGPDLPL